MRKVIAIGIGTAIAMGILYFTLKEPSLKALQDPKAERPKAPSLEGGIAWLNTAGPVKMEDLKGKVVLLDFWTLCCINCIHIMPDLAKL